MSHEVSAVSSTVATYVKPESLESSGRETRSDRARDDVRAPNAPPAPTVNPQGDQLGTIVNIRA